MGALDIDEGLHASLQGIREAVRVLFEQLRLRNESGDVSGKERLERVPALSKRNFGNLLNEDCTRAAREAWRLVDFLEGTPQADLTVIAREALRPVELDRLLAALRASEDWKSAAEQLRELLTATESRHSYREDASGLPMPLAPSATINGGDRSEKHSLGVAAIDRSNSPAKSRYRSRAIMLACVIVGCAAIVLSVVLFDRPKPKDPGLACLALESASGSQLAEHWLFDTPAPQVRTVKYQNPPIEVTISDPAAPAAINSIYTTSVFSWDGSKDHLGPGGGGRADARLMVGGWGDTYLSLLKIPIVNDRMVSRAILRLTVLDDTADGGTARPTSMTLRKATENWKVAPGGQDRLWWRDCPNSLTARRDLPPPGPVGSRYDIDITDIYNEWASGRAVNFGIILEPNNIGVYGQGKTGHSNFNIFSSTRAINPDNRPKLILY